MKFRNSFVSNSSTSSFVFIGTKVTEEEVKEKFNVKDDDFDAYEVLEEHGLEFLTNEQINDLKENEYIIGEEIASGDDSDFSAKVTELSDVDEMVDRLCKKLNRDRSVFKIYGGIRAC